MHFAEYDSPVGRLLLGSDGVDLLILQMERNLDVPLTEDSVLLAAKQWLDRYFQGEVPDLELPLRPEGTPFQRQVWQILLEIPWGQTRTYGEIARQVAAALGKEKMSAQAVGQAVGSNPISIVIPCHRVVGARGQLTGYAWGVEKKKWLLEHEKKQGGTVCAI